MQFRLYNAATGGTQQWSESRLVSSGQGVTVRNGQFSVQLGSVTTLPASLFTSNSLYFEVELPTPATATSSAPVWGEGPMSPRNQLATSAYAYNAETLDGIDGAAFGQLATSNVWTGATTFRPSTNATNSFAVQSSNASNLLVADSANARVQIGDPAADSTGVVLVLDSKNTAGDPVGVDGAMYYNANAKSFRCYQDGQWRACIGGLVASNTSPSTVAATTTQTAFAPSYTIPANNCVPGRVYRVLARGVYSTQGGLLGTDVIVRLRAGTAILAATGSVDVSLGVSNRQWTLNADVICITNGSGGNVEAAGTLSLSTGIDSTSFAEMANSSTIPLDMSSSQNLQITVQWGSANAANSMILRQFTVESLGP